MIVGLMAPDSKIPNLAIMKLSAWHKAQGDTIVFPWHGQRVDRLLVSLVFTRNRKEAEHLPQYAEVGGTGWDYTAKLPDEIEAMKPDYELYGINYGMGFLYRGCIRRCQFCVVHRKEGGLHRVGQISDLINPKSDKVIVLDANLLGEPDHLDTLAELADRKLQVNFSQGLDIRFVTPENAGALSRVAYRNIHFTRTGLHFAFDHPGLERCIRDGVETLRDAGIKPYRLTFYVLVGFQTCFEEDLHRVMVLKELGCDPYVMVYEDPEGGKVQQDPRLPHLERWANAKIHKTCRWEEYDPAQEAIARASGEQATLFREAII